MSHKTFSMIKPDATEKGHTGAILQMINKAGFRIAAMKMTHISKEKAGAFYEVHKERPFYAELVEFMSRGPITALILEKKNAVAQKSFAQSPSNFVDKWNTPIMIIQGGKDYRVPIEQGLQAFTAAQLKGIKSKLLYLPEENHWVLSPQTALVWQREFFKWLEETLR